MQLCIQSRLFEPYSGFKVLDSESNRTVGSVALEFLANCEEEHAQNYFQIFNKHHNILDWDSTLESQGVRDGDVLYLSCRRIPEFQPKYVALVGIMTLVIAISLLLVSTVLFGVTGREIPFDYGIVIDAGSTHTEAFLYQWSGNKFYGTGNVIQIESCLLDVGIAKVSDPSIIVPCVNNISKLIPQPFRPATPLYLGGTGGMRLLNASQPKDAKLILLALKYAFKTLPLSVNFVDIIEGKDEGIFSWITSNFLTQTLNPKEKQLLNFTYGALDMGGASTQFAYALNPSALTNSSDISLLKLYGYHYKVLAKSFICFGVTEIFNRLQVLLIKNLTSTQIYQPCLPKNFTLQIAIFKLFSSPCVKTKYFKDLFTNYENNLTFIGGSNYEECKNHVDMIFNDKVCARYGFKNCPEVNYIADDNRKFLAFSNYYYVTKMLNSTNASLIEFIDATKIWCKYTFEEILQHDYASSYNYLPYYCFSAIYITKFLNNYGFNDSTWKNLIFQDKIGKNDLGWSLGFMINATNAIPEESPTEPVISSTICVLLVFISLALAVIAIILIRSNYKYLFYKKIYTHEVLGET